MSTSIQDVMTVDLVSCPITATIEDAAKLMRVCDIGDVLVTDDRDQLAGIVTDRDLVIRSLAFGDAADATLEQACSRDVLTVSPTSSVGDAARLMREQALRRLPVVAEGRAVGIVSLGDLAIEQDPTSALGDISAAGPNS